MPQCTIHTPWDKPQARTVQAGATLFQAMGDHAAHLDTPCGGAGRCGKCLVRAQGALSPADSQERSALGARLDQGFRLACRAVIRGDVEVWLTEAHQDQRIRTDGALPDFPRDPLFARYGAAIDIGTTTLAARLYGEAGLLAQASGLNPQHTFGADVISRIQASMAGARTELARCMAAFVGADTTTALLASGLCRDSASALLADIGTNGELALWHGGVLSCCSTAAGPVFEGAGISQGMQGSAGAIDHVVWRSGTLHVHTIGEGPARGICGSGIIDGVAALLEGGLLDESGALEDDAEAVPLTAEVTLTQRDIRMVQLAKGAICAGIHTLLETAEIPARQPDRLAIAGGFGSYLDLGSAARIGLIPPALAEKGESLGNAALTGACMLLLNQAFLEESGTLARQAQVVELSANPIFAKHYIDAMSF